MFHGKFRHARLKLAAAALLVPAVPATAAGHDPDALAKQLANPIAALISLPFQLNYDSGYAADKDKWTLNIQPVVPMSISEDWNLISRTILPVITQGDTGLGDVVQSLFFSPKQPTSSAWILGAGPAFLLPTGSKDFSLDQWAAGPTVVGLKQVGPWTYGVLANHLWGVSNSGTQADLNATYLQPFVSKGLGGGVTLMANFEATYDWNGAGWNLPLNVVYTKVTKVGTQLLSFGVGVRAYLDTPAGGPDWGLRGVVTLLFPK